MPYLMNCRKTSSKILRSNFSYVYGNLFVNENTNDLVLIHEQVIKCESNAERELPHKKEGPSHIPQAVFQHQATKKPFNTY